MHGLRRQGTHKRKSACYQKLMSMKEKFGSCANMGREQIEENLKIKGNERSIHISIRTRTIKFKALMVDWRFRKMAAGRVLVLHKGRDSSISTCLRNTMFDHQDSRAGTRGSLEASPAPVSRWQPRRHRGQSLRKHAYLIRRQTLKKQFKST
ncbi:uncharacterized protein [Triticum aestivum]|uniref:uncharacterized protein isoform X1 n=1 Tax=Triticum aestivum TaxID=4565 RepID=UPI001D02F52B|nr:uncharacterized protein LOC123071946 isoform X1 [Triticum aestivum]